MAKYIAVFLAIAALAVITSAAAVPKKTGSVRVAKNKNIAVSQKTGGDKDHHYNGRGHEHFYVERAVIAPVNKKISSVRRSKKDDTDTDTDTSDDTGASDGTDTSDNDGNSSDSTSDSSTDDD